MCNVFGLYLYWNVAWMPQDVLAFVAMKYLSILDDMTKGPLSNAWKLQYLGKTGTSLADSTSEIQTCKTQITEAVQLVKMITSLLKYLLCRIYLDHRIVLQMVLLYVNHKYKNYALLCQKLKHDAHLPHLIRRERGQPWSKDAFFKQLYQCLWHFKSLVTVCIWSLCVTLWG